GLWSEGGAIVAYDLDLTNGDELKGLVELEPVRPVDAGQLLWALYRRFGSDFIDKLRGAFAFALWDGGEEKLFVVTDFYGIRPVVFSGTGGTFAAASRIRQLALAGIDKTLNPEAIYHYLFFQAICSPVSIYQNVHKLEPGMGLAVQGDQVWPFVYYDIKYKTLTRGETHWQQAIPAAIEKAVGHFVAPQALDRSGCFLSGGTDSSTVAGYYTRLSGRPAKTFSIGFDDPYYNELDFARIAVKHFGTDQHEYLVTPADVLGLIEELPKIYDEPFGNASVVAAYFCAQLAKQQGVEVMLGGDGGDEIFGGNERYVTNLVFERYFQLPGIVRTGMLEPLLGALQGKGPIYKAQRYVRRANMRNPRRFYSYNLLAEHDNREIFQEEFLRRVDTDCFFKRAQAVYDRAAPAEDTDRLLYLDMKYTITDNDLRKVTQMVEAAGLQVRYPLLDRDLVDFAATIPPWLKVRPGKNRYMFKQAMRGFLPDEIIRKTKHGMGLPIAKWLKGDAALRSLLEDNLFSGNPEIHAYVKPDYLQSLRCSFLSESSPYYGDSLWVFLILQLWLRHHK
ncbi:MAG: asparagine synthase-related protein, partial [Candidatus Vecturithrix sp.]|nr:asparagine synthase-related protein [Candidatus Vecturithrix sp.]